MSIRAILMGLLLGGLSYTSVVQHATVLDLRVENAKLKNSVKFNQGMQEWYDSRSHLVETATRLLVTCGYKFEGAPKVYYYVDPDNAKRKIYIEPGTNMPKWDLHFLDDIGRVYITPKDFDPKSVECDHDAGLKLAFNQLRFDSKWILENLDIVSPEFIACHKEAMFTQDGNGYTARYANAIEECGEKYPPNYPFWDGLVHLR